MRNTYIDGTRADAIQRRCDIVQLKYDGHWCRMVSDGVEQTYFSDTDRVFKTEEDKGLVPCVLIGEFMRGTQWAQHPERKGKFYVFDMWELRGVPLADVYKRRITRFRQEVMPTMPANFVNAQWFRMAQADAVWNEYVERQGYEGLVYRWSDGMIDHPIVREKKVFTLDGIAVDFKPGNGKYEGILGAVVVQVYNGNTVDVGGGFSDEERLNIWDNQAAYRGKKLEFEASAVFASGSARHPRFVRWKEDV